MAKQEKRISYKAGITRTPSDFLCKDGELAECINLTTDNEELKPMVPPSEWMKAGSGETLPEILYVHRINGDDVIIGVKGSSNSYTLEYGRNNSGVYSKTGDFSVGGASLTKTTKPVSITSVNRILIVSYSDGINYFQWDSTNGYKGMSSALPDVKVEFYLYDSRQEDPGRPLAFNISGLVHHEPVYNPDNQLEAYSKLTTENEEEYQGVKDVLIGAISERIKKVWEQKRFAFPFWARYAVRLYDGTYTHISQPFLLFPTVNHNCDIFFSDVNGNEQNLYMRTWSDGVSLNYKPLSAELTCKISGNISGWEDIIAGVDIFVSEQQTPFNLEGDWNFINPFDTDHMGNAVLYNSASGPCTQMPITASAWGDTTTKKLGFVTYFGMTHINDSELMKNLLDKSIFYRIAQIDRTEFSQFSSFASLSDKMTQTTLPTLTSQTRLSQDDYYSRNSMKAEVMKAYNMRLHLAKVSRDFFDGFDLFTGAEYNNQSASYKIAVDIKTDSGMRTVVKTVPATSVIMNIWFYYPDPRATRVRIYNGNNYLLFDLPLTEHKSLNGAYFFDHLPYVGETMPSGTSATSPTAYNAAERINNRIFVSETDNPFVFSSNGDVKVGQGDIIGMATQTVAIGQEEHGLHPLTVFTDRGISVLRVDRETGNYLNADELNREVCINPKSITETDGAVFFVSKKGLMILAGEQIRCVSEQINGLPFSADSIVDATTGGASNPAYDWASIITACKDWYLDNGQRKVISFLDYIADEGCRIAYDYIDSRLLMVNPSRSFAFVYSMKDGTISKTVLPGAMNAVVANYPDYIMQSGNTVYSLYGKPLEESLTNRTNNMQRAFIFTRPIKLAGPLAVSSLRELVNVGMWQKKDAQGNELSCVKSVVWISDNLIDWYQVSSRFGAAAKYFRIGLFINMLPTERLSGTIITEQERRTNNLHA